MQYIYLYLLTIPVFFVIDIIWLAFVARGFYQSQLGHLLGEVNWGAAVPFYFIYIGAILLFAAVPALESGSALKAVLLGATFGFVAYATYDLTNLATIKDWPLIVTIVDLIWGTVLTASVAVSAFFIGKFIGM